MFIYNGLINHDKGDMNKWRGRRYEQVQNIDEMYQFGTPSHYCYPKMALLKI